MFIIINTQLTVLFWDRKSPLSFYFPRIMLTIFYTLNKLIKFSPLYTFSSSLPKPAEKAQMLAQIKLASVPSRWRIKLPWNHWSIFHRWRFGTINYNIDSRGGCAAHMGLAGWDRSCGQVWPVDMMSHEYLHIRLCSSDQTFTVAEISLSAELRLRSCM